MASIPTKSNICSETFLFKGDNDDFDNLSCSLSDQLNRIPNCQEINSLNEFYRSYTSSGDVIGKGYYFSEDFKDLSSNHQDEENFNDSDTKCRENSFLTIKNRKEKIKKEQKLKKTSNGGIIKLHKNLFKDLTSKSINSPNFNQIEKTSKNTVYKSTRAKKREKGKRNDSCIRSDRLRIDVINKRLLRGFRKIVFKFAEKITNENNEIKCIVKELKQSKSERSCSKSREIIKWLDEILSYFEISEKSKEELFALLISFIFKTKMNSILGKICDHQPKRFNSEIIKMKIKNFKNISNRLTAKTRSLLFAHPVIRLGKSLYLLSPVFQSVFWKSESSSPSPYAPMSRIERDKILSLMDQVEELKMKRNSSSNLIEIFDE